MGNEKFVNYYIEGLITTLNDCLIRNISLQANERISKEVIEEHTKKVEGLNGTIDTFKADLEKAKSDKLDTDNTRYQNLENSIKDHLNTINTLNQEISQLKTMKSEYENVKHQVQHVDTFRTELTKTREELNNVRNDYEKRIADLTSSHESQIKELNDKIDYLQLTPAKRKKVEEVKKEVTETPMTPTIDVFSNSEDTLKDGGSF